MSGFLRTSLSISSFDADSRTRSCSLRSSLSSSVVFGLPKRTVPVGRPFSPTQMQRPRGTTTAHCPCPAAVAVQNNHAGCTENFRKHAKRCHRPPAQKLSRSAWHRAKEEGRPVLSSAASNASNLNLQISGRNAGSKSKVKIVCSSPVIFNRHRHRHFKRGGASSSDLGWPDAR